MLYDIKQIRVNKRDYLITILKLGEYYTAYVYLDGSRKYEEEFLNYPTYRNGDVVGIDTNHSFNMEMSIQEKYKDAIRQIKNMIKAYQKIKEQTK